MKRLIIILLCLYSAASTYANIDVGKGIVLNGSLQSDILFPEQDKKIGADAPEETALTNTYLDLNLQTKYITAGGRFEFLRYPLPGFDKDFRGWGVPYLFVSGKYKQAELTLGDFYEQFGSGLILRTYEDRALGIDNSIRGGRLKVTPYKGLQIKALGGCQRRYWQHNDALLWGADIELSIDEWSRKLQEQNTHILFGASYLAKHEPEDEIYVFDEKDGTLKRLNFPNPVGAADFRLQVQKGAYSLLAEYAQKANDPTTDNRYSYKKGSAALLSATYSRKGLSALVQAKRSENMSFRSRRLEQGTASYINHLPAFTTQHTYALAAIYPYATQQEGEWAFQGELNYKLRKTLFRFNASHIRSLQKTLYFQDIALSADRRLSKDLQLTALYSHQTYNPLIAGHIEDVLKANVFVVEGKYKFNRRYTLRSEWQYLLCSPYKGSSSVNFIDRSNQGDWLFGLVELSVSPILMFSLSDMYNIGGNKEHYYMASAVGIWRSHRLQLGYGRTRAGYDCSGGLCRFVPASRGFRINYIFNF
ncbi:hypothetical protein FACS189434_12730 [Bacteroidia bacterium]|nr:hypothetical protein FACS189434_12730 [Bacteroidia bacterium]